ncbi:hypothetical protein C7M84_014019 [Penaeus vannamei]|uniref:Uncharacterized protein n=1 Tax=Penaeus vannamei TaxID=6689 RepID=A0A423SUI9_PENVA|nr:hypothetical protein C7M84_014019 [Penaeus vannamei]
MRSGVLEGPHLPPPSTPCLHQLPISHPLSSFSRLFSPSSFLSPRSSVGKRIPHISFLSLVSSFLSFLFSFFLSAHQFFSRFLSLFSSPPPFPTILLKRNLLSSLFPSLFFLPFPFLLFSLLPLSSPSFLFPPSSSPNPFFPNIPSLPLITQPPTPIPTPFLPQPNPPLLHPILPQPKPTSLSTLPSSSHPIFTPTQPPLLHPTHSIPTPIFTPNPPFSTPSPHPISTPKPPNPPSPTQPPIPPNPPHPHTHLHPHLPPFSPPKPTPSPPHLHPQPNPPISTHPPPSPTQASPPSPHPNSTPTPTPPARDLPLITQPLISLSVKRMFTYAGVPEGPAVSGGSWRCSCGERVRVTPALMTSPPPPLPIPVTSQIASPGPQHSLRADSPPTSDPCNPKRRHHVLLAADRKPELAKSDVYANASPASSSPNALVGGKVVRKMMSAFIARLYGEEAVAMVCRREGRGEGGW